MKRFQTVTRNNRLTKKERRSRLGTAYKKTGLSSRTDEMLIADVDSKNLRSLFEVSYSCN